MIHVLRNLLAYVVAGSIAIVAGSVLVGVPLAWVAWTVFLVEAVPLFTWGGALLVRRMMRQARPQRQDWTHLTCDHIDHRPPERVVGEIVEPVMRPHIRVLPLAQIEAPGKELEAYRGK